jgi:hypothetical protein
MVAVTLATLRLPAVYTAVLVLVDLAVLLLVFGSRGYPLGRALLR